MQISNPLSIREMVLGGSGDKKETRFASHRQSKNTGAKKTVKRKHIKRIAESTSIKRYLIFIRSFNWTKIGWWWWWRWVSIIKETFATTKPSLSVFPLMTERCNQASGRARLIRSVDLLPISIALQRSTTSKTERFGDIDDIWYSFNNL